MEDEFDVPPAPDPPQQHSHTTSTNRLPLRATRAPSKPPPVARSGTLSGSSLHGDGVVDPYGARFEAAASAFSTNGVAARGGAHKRGVRDGCGNETHRLMFFTGGCVFSTVLCAFALLPLCGWRARNGYQRQNRLFYCLGAAFGMMLFAAIACVVVLLFVGVYGGDGGDGWRSPS